MAKSMIASKVERYGKLTDLRIQSGEKSITAEILLEGESQPIQIGIGRYRIVKSGESYGLIAENVTATRLWVKNLLEDFLLEKEIQIPAMALLAFGKADV